MLVAQMTDIHIGFDPDAKPEELNRIRFRKTLDRLLAQPNPIDLLVLSGDLTDHGDFDSFEKTAALLERVTCPILPMVGNHDSREGLLHAFPDTPTEGGFVHYTHQQDGLLLIMLDTLEDGRHGGAFCPARRDWLRGQLEANSGTPTLIFMHHPPVVSGVDWMDPAPDEEWIANFAEAIAGHGQILAIHCGHLHRPIMTTFHGVPLGVTPSVAPLVSLDLRPVDPSRADNRDLITTEPATYALHRWDGQSLVTHYEKTNNWDVLAFYGEHLKPMMKDMFRERQ